MCGFTLCAACRREYEEPRDRRFHAQPTACPACGPRLALWNRTGQALAHDDEALRGAAAALLDGRVVAVKGLGGFHLCCDARNEAAVARLRAGKVRREKPLAVMVRDVAAARALCEVSGAAERWLLSPEAPILLLPRLGPEGATVARRSERRPRVDAARRHAPVHAASPPPPRGRRRPARRHERKPLRRADRDGRTRGGGAARLDRRALPRPRPSRRAARRRQRRVAPRRGAAAPPPCAGLRSAPRPRSRAAAADPRRRRAPEERRRPRARKRGGPFAARRRPRDTRGVGRFRAGRRRSPPSLGGGPRRDRARPPSRLPLHAVGAPRGGRGRVGGAAAAARFSRLRARGACASRPSSTTTRTSRPASQRTGPTAPRSA